MQSNPDAGAVHQMPVRIPPFASSYIALCRYVVAGIAGVRLGRE